MKRFFRTSVAFAAFGLATSHWAVAGDNFIVQPKLKPAKPTSDATVGTASPSGGSSRSSSSESIANSVNNQTLATNPGPVEPAVKVAQGQAQGNLQPDPQSVGSNTVYAKPVIQYSQPQISAQSPSYQVQGEQIQSQLFQSQQFQSQQFQSQQTQGQQIQNSQVASNGRPANIANRTSQQDWDLQQYADPETQRDSNGLTWVKRGTSEGNRIASTIDNRNGRVDGRNGSSGANQVASTQVNSVEIAVPATAKSAPRNYAPRNFSPPSGNDLDTQATSVVQRFEQPLEQLPAQRSLPQAADTQPQWQTNSAASSAIARAADSEGQPKIQLVPAVLASDNSQREEKLQLASRVSKRILGEEPETKQILAGGSSVAGPAAVEKQLTQLILNSEQLCRRGLFLSAREEAESAQLKLSRYLDSISNAYRSEPAIRQAQKALAESSAFEDVRSENVIAELVKTHETPVLKNVDVSASPPSTLGQVYYQFAESKLLEGSQQHPWFSDIFYTLGRTYQAESDSRSGTEAEQLRLQAIVYYRAAVTIRPSNAIANNQLGYVLLQLDRPQEARMALIASVDNKADVPALQNLVEASRRLGDTNMQRWALQMIANIQRNSMPANQGPEVLEIDNRTFQATTPLVPTRTNSSTVNTQAPAVNSATTNTAPKSTGQNSRASSAAPLTANNASPGGVRGSALR